MIRRCFALLLAGTVLAHGPALAEPAAQEQVRIYRDGKGVPHIFGETAPAVLFGTGYAIAQDRLAQLELRRRGVQGRRAEILGPSALEGDKTALDRMLPPAELMRMYRALPAEYQAMMQAYVDGLNRYIDGALASPRTSLPYEFSQWGVLPQRWTLLDYLGFIASMPGDRASEELHNAAFLQAMVDRHGETAGRAIFEDVVPLSDPDTPTVIPPGEDLAPAQPMPVPGTLFKPRRAGGPIAARPSPLPRQASRCLVVGPERSASGHVLMLQATADGPEMHLRGGGFDTAGFSSLGWGPPIMGRSARHGWYITSGEADATDIFEVALNPADRYRYRYNGQWRRMTRTTSMIAVKGQAPVAHEVARTVHGTVVQWDAKTGVAYAERFAGRGHELENWVAMVEMARARDIDEFERKGVARLGWNLGICYGDVTGQVGFWEAGNLPRRAPGADARLPTPGTGAHEWRGFLDFAEHPRLRNPKQGFLYLWNSKATNWSVEGDGARMGKTFRSWSGTDLAAANASVTLLDLREWNGRINNALGGTDRTQTKPAFFAPALTRALARNEDPEVAEAIRLMLAFDGYYVDADKDGFYDAPGLPLFREWLTVAPKAIFGPTMDDWWTRIDEGRYLQYQTSLLWRALAGDDAGLKLNHDYLKGRDRDTLILETVRQVVRDLKTRFGNAPMAQWRQRVFWKYFDASKETPDRPAMPDPDARPDRLASRLGLDVAAVPHHGGDEWTAMMELSPDAQPKIYTITDTGGQNRFISVAGHGNPHLSDQTRMHADNEFKTIEMAPDKVKAVAESVEVLEYSPRR